MLKRRNAPITKRKVIAYDFEWYPKRMEFRLAGAYSEKRGYHWETSVDDFIDKELTGETQDSWYYAHAGGFSDIQFLLQKFIERGYNVKCIFSGSSAVIVKVLKTKVPLNNIRKKRDYQSFTFIDSYLTIREPLRKIGKVLGYPKGDVDFSAPLSELIPYNRRDCEILYKAITGFEKVVNDSGGELKMTLASTALDVILRRYWSDDVRTSEKLNAEIASGYNGGRVEVFYRGLHGGYFYDVRSCYPYAMTSVLPGNHIGTVTDGRFLESDKIYIADIDVHVPEMNIPPLPAKVNGSLFFPTGNFRGIFARPEIERALESGCTIKKVHKIWMFDPFTDLRDFCRDMYDRRKEYDDGSYMRLVYKLLMNSGYGKFGQHPDSSSIYIHPTIDEFGMFARLKEEALRDGKPDPVTYLMPGIFALTEKRHVKTSHYPIAIYVTSLARALLHTYMSSAEPKYCDTDGFGTSRSDLPESKELGGLEKKVYQAAIFRSPKMYALRDAAGIVQVRAKGFSDMNKKLPNGEYAPNIERMKQILKGERVPVTRTIRIRENFRRGVIYPREIESTKEIRYTSWPKRCFFNDGNSRPWDYAELQDRSNLMKTTYVVENDFFDEIAIV